GRGALVEDAAGPGPVVPLPGFRRVPAVREFLLGGRHLPAGQMAGADRRRDRGGRRRRGVLVQVPPPGHVRAGRTADQRRTVADRRMDASASPEAFIPNAVGIPFWL